MRLQPDAKLLDAGASAAQIDGAEGDILHRILQIIDRCGECNSAEIAQQLGIDHQKCVGSLKSLSAKQENFIELETIQRKEWKLTHEGAEVAANGSHEAVLYRAIPSGGISQEELMV